MKIGIVGSRKFPRSDLVRAVVNKFKEDDVLVSGGCKDIHGKCPDWVAERIIDLKGMDKIIHKPDFSDGYDVKKFHERNAEIVRDSDVMIVFWDKTSPGTKSTLRKMIEESEKLG